MSNKKNDLRSGPALTWLDRHWVSGVVLFWLLVSALLIYQKWAAIHWFALSDTDDNLRLVQVRDWLNGQGWYDLRQYRLNPPEGFNVHWSRLVDLPIAGLELVLRPFLDSVEAERWAAAIAPLFAMLATMLAIGLIARRLLGPVAWLLGVAIAACGQISLINFAPLRIDHHGWQLAFLAWALAGFADPRPVRGGITMAVATALSLAIGLELMPFLAIVGGGLVFRWILSPGARTRLLAYGATLAPVIVAAFVLFASADNRVFRCDALTPVWTIMLAATGILALVLALASPRSVALRIALAAAGGGMLAVLFVSAFPQCLGAPEQISPELRQLWFNNIREAQPIYKKDLDKILAFVALPMAGLIGYLLATWRARNTPKMVLWLTMLLMAVLADLLMLWQTRNASPAELIAVPGATALAWIILPPLRKSPNIFVRTLGVVAAFLLISGIAIGNFSNYIPVSPASPGSAKAGKATSRCMTQPALLPVAKLPPTTIFTLVDMGPRLIALTPHKAIAGPYHRNGDAILDVHHAFGGSPEEARAIMLRHGATMLLICPGSNESTIHVSRHPKGFYARVEQGERFDWLVPVALPKGSPLRLYRIIPSGTPAN